MPVTPPTRVIASHLRWPLRHYRLMIYQLVTEAGDFATRKPPLIFDRAGQPTTLTSDLAPGSIVRVEHDGRALRSVQLLTPLYQNPFGLLLPTPEATE